MEILKLDNDPGIKDGKISKVPQTEPIDSRSKKQSVWCLGEIYKHSNLKIHWPTAIFGGRFNENPRCSYCTMKYILLRNLNETAPRITSFTDLSG